MHVFLGDEFFLCNIVSIILHFYHASYNCGKS